MAGTLIVILSALGAGAAAAEREPTPSPRSAHRVTQDPEDIRSYWTPERMARARPIGEIKTKPAAASGARKGPSFTRTKVRNLSYPRSAHGKVFTSYNGEDFKCSATAVASPREDLVWTAGHCIFNWGFGANGSWAENWVFVPAYRKGTMPYDMWTAIELFAAPQWLAARDHEFDLAAARVDPIDGRTLREVVGSRGISFGTARDQLVRSFGYPNGDPFDGESGYVCKSELGKSYDEGGPGPDMLEMGCDMRTGSSGGGWVAKGAVISVFSIHRQFVEDTQYGPYHGGEARDFYRSITGVEGSEPAPPERRRHRSSITFEIGDDRTAIGGIEPRSIYPFCAQRVPIHLLRSKRGRPFRIIGSKTTAKDGSFSFRLPRGHASYQILAPRRAIDRFNRCAKVESDILTR